MPEVYPSVDTNNDGLADDAAAVGGTAADDMATDAETATAVATHEAKTLAAGHAAVALAALNAKISDATLMDSVDEDNMASDSATKVPTQQSVKKYVDDNAGGDTIHFDVDLSGTFDFKSEGDDSTDPDSNITVDSDDLALLTQCEVVGGKLEIDATCNAADIDAVLSVPLTGLPDLVDRTILGLEVDIELHAADGVNADRLIAFAVVNDDNLGDMSTIVSVAPTATEYEQIQIYKNTGPRMDNWSARANVHERASTIILTAAGDAWRLRLAAWPDRVVTSATQTDNTRDELSNAHASKSHANVTAGGVPYFVISINPRTGGTEGDIHVSVSKIRVFAA
ncbi:hypothetical protein HN937_29925 [Candidatus Poribacteria bacterium]|jgi:hypothetical protein|nr:hypothetical protein [Candidatus Poribacteria bacterium]